MTYYFRVQAHYLGKLVSKIQGCHPVDYFSLIFGQKQLRIANPAVIIFIVLTRRPVAGNFCFGLVTFKTYKPGWLVRILSEIIVIQLLS